MGLPRQASLTSFPCPDVRRSSEEDLGAYNGRDWVVVKPGVAYVGTCQNRKCVSHTSKLARTPGLTVCNMGMGTHRPNEQMCYDEIRCPGCQQPFRPEEFNFQYCSAKINYCIDGGRADKICLSENRSMKSRVLGKRGTTVIYNMLNFEVDRPDAFEDDDTLDARDTGAGDAAAGAALIRKGFLASVKSSVFSALRPSALNPNDMNPLCAQNSDDPRFRVERKMALRGQPATVGVQESGPLVSSCQVCGHVLH